MDQQKGTGDIIQLPSYNDLPSFLGYGSVSGSRWAEGIETAGSRSTGEGRRLFTDTLSKKLPSISRPVPIKVIHTRRFYLQSCIDALENAENNSEDIILKSNCLTDVQDHLQVLWELLEGDSESEAFEEIINVLQIAFCHKSLETLTPNQLSSIKSVLVKLHENPDIEDHVANEFTQELIRGGVDVFREIE
jgi:hypothetical protein